MILILKSFNDLNDAQLPKTEKSAAGVPRAQGLCARSTNM